MRAWTAEKDGWVTSFSPHNNNGSFSSFMQGSLYSSSETVTFQQTAHYHSKSDLEVIELSAEFGVFFSSFLSVSASISE